MPTIQIDCSRLDENELIELADFLTELPQVEHVGITSLETIQDREPVAGELGEVFAAAASPAELIVAVHFLKTHWPAIAGAGSAALSFGKGAAWLVEQLKKWTSARAAKYELRPILGPDGEAVSFVKVAKIPPIP